MVGNDPKFRSTFEVAAPHCKCMHHRQEFLFARSVVDLRRGKAPAFKGNRALVLIENCSQTMERGVRVNLKWLGEIWESQARGSGQSQFDGLESRGTGRRPLPWHVLTGETVQRRSHVRKVTDELAKISGLAKE